MFSHHTTADDHARRAFAEFAQRKDSIILEQLGDLIKQGLLVIVETQPVMTFDPSTSTLKVEGAVKLHLRDQERLDELQREIESLKADKARFIEAFRAYGGPDVK